MARGVTIDLIVDPSGAVTGFKVASEEADKANTTFADFAKVGAAAIAAVATAAAAVATGLAVATVKAGEYADEILTAATNTGLGTDELQAYRYAAEQIDVSFETFTKSQGKFTKSMQDAVRSGASPAAEAFASLGLSVTDSSGNLVDSTELYWQAIDALGGVTNETERTALAQQIFGKSGAEMNSLIAQGSEGFRELTEEARRNGAIMSGEQLEKLGAFDDKMQALNSTVDAAKNALGLTLLPILDELAGSGTSALGEFTSALLEADGDMSKAAPAFESLGTNIAQALTTAIPKILEVATSLISGLLDGLVKNAPKLIEAAIPLLVSFVEGILGMLPKVLDAGLKIVIAIVQGIATALPRLIPAAVSAVLGLVGALISNLPLLLDVGLQLIVALQEGVLAAYPVLIEALPEIILGIVDFLIGAIPQLIETGIALLTALIEALPEIIVAIVTAIPKIIAGIQTAVLSSLPVLIEAGIKLFVALIGAMPTIVKEIVYAMPQIITGIVGAIVAAVPQLIAAGGDLIRGLWQGIQRMGDWLWKQIQSFFGDVIDNIKALFGIHSPSTVFAGLGKNMILGWEEGLSGPNHLGSIMSDLSKQVVNGFEGNLSATVRATAVRAAKTEVRQTSTNARVAFPSQVTLVDRDGSLLGLMDVKIGDQVWNQDSDVAGGVIR